MRLLFAGYPGVRLVTSLQGQFGLTSSSLEGLHYILREALLQGSVLQ